MNDPEGFSEWWLSENNGLVRDPVLSDCRRAYRAGQESRQATIATLTAEREKVRELVEAVLKERDLQAQSNGYISYAIDDVYELAQTLAAQLREQDDE